MSIFFCLLINVSTHHRKCLKQLQETYKIEDLLLENLEESLTFMFHYGPNNLWLTDILPTRPLYLGTDLA